MNFWAYKSGFRGFVDVEEVAGGCAEMEVEVAGVEEVDFVLFDEEEGVIHIARSTCNGRGAWSRDGGSCGDKVAT